MNELSKKWAWSDDDEDEVDLLQILESKEEKASQEEKDSQIAQKRSLDEWYYDGTKEVLDTGVSSEDSLHKEIQASRELTEEEENKVKTLYEKKIDRLKLKNVSNDATDEVIISSSGMTLSDWLNKTHLRNNKGRRRERDEERREDKILAISDRTKKPLYAKTALQMIEQDEKRKLKKTKTTRKVRSSMRSGKYKNMAPNEHELLKSLGMTEEELISKVGVNSLLTEREKAMILSEGYFGVSKTTNVGVQRTYTTLGDIQILAFLYRFQIASINILSIALSKSKRAITGQLGKLYNMGLVDKIPLEGNLYVWGITKLGQSIITEDTKAPKKPKLKGVSQLLTINYVVGCLYSNSINALLLDDFPYYGREFQDTIVKGEEIIPERYLRSSLFRVSSEMGFGRSINDAINNRVLEQAEIKWREWEMNGRIGDSPELEPGNEYLYLLYPKGSFTDTYVVPDLVLKRPRSEDGSPNNIAIEVERQIKTVGEYKKKLMAYQQDDRVYGKVIYITSSKSVYERVTQAAEELQYEDYKVVPFLDENGDMLKIIDPWRL